MELAARDLKRVSLELGGKSPNIVFADADWQRAAETSPMSVFANTGQDCCARSRIFVERSVYAPFVESFVAATRKLAVGDPARPETQLGPLVSAAQRATVEDYLSDARANRARFALGGNRCEPRGYYLEPAVLVDVEKTQRCWREEIFGPVVCIAPFDDERQMIREVNASPYGLSGSIWTNDLRRALRVARAVESGVLSMNSHSSVHVEAPVRRVQTERPRPGSWHDGDGRIHGTQECLCGGLRSDSRSLPYEPRHPQDPSSFTAPLTRCGRPAGPLRPPGGQAIPRPIFPRLRVRHGTQRMQLPAHREPRDGPPGRFKVASWDAGFGDFALRRISGRCALPWQPATALVICDHVRPDGSLVVRKRRARCLSGNSTCWPPKVSPAPAPASWSSTSSIRATIRLSRAVTATCSRRAITALTTTSCSRPATSRSCAPSATA